MDTSDSIQNIAAALCKVQAKLRPIKRNAENPFFKSSYVDLANLAETLFPLLTAEGLSIVQGGDGTCLSTRLLHSSGEWIETSLPMPAESNPQKLGSTVTYFRRYALAAIVGAVSEGEDDDGNAASHPPARTASAPPPAPRPPAETGARPATTSPAPAAPAGGGPALHVQFLDQAAGEKADKQGVMRKWVRFTAKFSDGTKASTFDTVHGEVLAEAKAKGLPVHVGFEQKGQFTNITHVALAGAGPDDEDSVPF